MNYTDWNQLIGKYFFNTSMSEKEVFLFMSKEDLICLGRPYFDSEEYSDDNFILRDFISATKKGVEGAVGTLLEKAYCAYKDRNKIKLDCAEDNIQYPAYLSYLVLLVMPLTETLEDSINVNNYYSRLNQFIGAEKDRHSVNSVNYSDNKIFRLWDDLEEWANEDMAGTLGLFFHRKFSHTHWRNVGTMFSQCILPPRSFRNFSGFFLKYNFVPHNQYPVEFFKHKLVTGGLTFLQLPSYISSLFKNENSHELVDKILEITQREYAKWEGNIVTQDINLSDYDNSTIARLYLQLKYSYNNESIEFSYRALYRNDYPEDLLFNNQEVYEEINSFSNTIVEEFKPEFILEDKFNRWKAIFQKKDIRLFINASYYQLENSFWLETDTLSSIERMMILCTKDKKETIEKWLKEESTTFSAVFNNFDGIPDGYCIYSFEGAKNSLYEESGLIVKKDKSVKMLSELKLDYRTFMRVILPEVQIENADGSEEVFLEYKETEEIHDLQRISGTEKWLLPEAILLNKEFKIKVRNQEFFQNYTNYKIVSADNTAFTVFEDKSPTRDQYGSVSNEVLNSYLKGNELNGVDFNKQHAFRNLFYSSYVDTNKSVPIPQYNHNDGNVLLSFLTIRQKLKAKDFYAAFEFLSTIKLKRIDNGTFRNITRAKKFALNYYDYLGFVDYDYHNDSIIINPPQLIYIPSFSGRSVLLIGARDKSLVDAILKNAVNYKLHVEINSQYSSNENLLLPDRIVIHAFENDGDWSIRKLAESLKIKFNSERLHQIGLYLLNGTVDGYEQVVLEKNRSLDDYGSCSKYIFNPSSLAMDKLENEEFDKNMSLLEYKFREWERIQVLWKDGKCYKVDRNWGRFLVLKNLQKNVIVYDRDKKIVAIPTSTPLPRLLFESITLMSGFAPMSKKIQNRWYWIFENIESIYIINMLKKLGQKPIEQEIN